MLVVREYTVEGILFYYCHYVLVVREYTVEILFYYCHYVLVVREYTVEGILFYYCHYVLVVREYTVEGITLLLLPLRASSEGIHIIPSRGLDFMRPYGLDSNVTQLQPTC